MGDLSFLWIFLIIVTCGFGAILYLLVTHDSEELGEKKMASKPVDTTSKVVIDKDLTERQRNILTYVIEKKMVKPPELRKIAGDVSNRTVRRDMSVLIDKGLISQEGSTKSTYYRYLGK